LRTLSGKNQSMTVHGKGKKKISFKILGRNTFTREERQGGGTVKETNDEKKRQEHQKINGKRHTPK